MSVLLEADGMSLGEALATGGETAVIGLGIVFSVLIILMIVLMLFKVVFYREPKKEEKVQEASSPVIEAEAEPNDEELIAVLTAAVAASLNTSTYNLNIKSYRKVNNSKTAWSRAGLTETINNRF